MLALGTSLFAQGTVCENVKLRVNSETGVYAKGDTVRVWADVKAVPDGPLTFKVMRWCDWDAESETSVTLEAGSTLLFERVFDESVQYVFELTDGVNPWDFKADYAGNQFAGIVVAPEGFKVGFSEPKDLMKFWRKEIRNMRREAPAPVITNDETKDGFRTYHVDINCVGPAPVRAYVSYPEGAARKSLPIIINLHSAGKPGSPSRAQVALDNAKIIEGGALAMDINAHGMLDDQPQSYYDELNEGALNLYSTREPSDLDNYYFKWMMLRAVRALDYLCANPLWDGKHVIVTGTSQGGYQSAWLAGIDKRVTAAVLTVPAGLDQGAELQGRPDSWPKTMKNFRESSLKNLPYMDPAAFIYRTKADVWCEIGLWDFTCPAANIFAVMNTLKGEKTIVTWQRPHSIRPNDEERAVHREVVGPQRIEFFRKAAKK